VELDCITPLVLTYNEEVNIGRTLDRLSWASRIVVVDSYSNDDTVEIAKSYPPVDLLQREFDDFASQCNYGLEHISTEWVLSLDADYVCSQSLIEEIRGLPDAPSKCGYSVEFEYCTFGEPLRGSLYPPRTVLYRRSLATYRQDGHGHRVDVEGPVGQLEAPIYHDDRKSLSVWLDSQRRYAHREADKLRTSSGEISFVDRLRKTRVLGPILTPVYCLFGLGLFLDGAAGWYYTLQRTYAELLLALELLDRDLRQDP